MQEIPIKQALVKPTGPPDLLDVLEHCDLTELPIRSRHALEAGSLPPLHRDPFDRRLVAQTCRDRLTSPPRIVDRRSISLGDHVQEGVSEARS